MVKCAWTPGDSDKYGVVGESVDGTLIFITMRRAIIAFLLCLCCMTAAAGKDLRGDIEKVIAGRQATIGVAVMCAVLIRSEQLHENTYSPLRDRYPGQDIRISYLDIIGYTVSHSDNNTCDLLIGFTGGIDKVDSCIKSLGITDLNLTETEADMHEDIRNGYLNWSTPFGRDFEHGTFRIFRADSAGMFVRPG